MASATTILVVDDQEELAENLAEILEGAGYRTLVAHTAEDAVEAVRTREVAGVVADYRLPGQNGVDMIASLRAAGSTAPVVVVTGFADDAVVGDAERAGALEVLAKPVDVQKLLGIVGDATERKRH